ncbi:hypothetical protein ACT4UT_36010, partial [Bacillus sp. B-TM1]
MNFRQLALNNVKGNWRNYKAFLISSCLSIVVFFMYASFIYHPDVVSGNISMREMISKGLESMNYIVVIFSALFILYANLATHSLMILLTLNLSFQLAHPLK